MSTFILAVKVEPSIYTHGRASNIVFTQKDNMMEITQSFQSCRNNGTSVSEPKVKSTRVVSVEEARSVWKEMKIRGFKQVSEFQTIKPI